MAKGFIIIFLILIFSISINARAQSFNPSDIEWGDNTSSTLHKGDSLIFGEYTVKVIEFTSPVQGEKIIENTQTKIVPENPVDPMVHIQIFKNNTFIQDTFLSLESSTFTDQNYEYRVIAKEFPTKMAQEWVMEYYNPWVTLAVQKRGVPSFEVDVNFTPSRSNFFDGETVVINLIIKNVGYGFAKNVEFDTDIGYLNFIGANSLRQNFDRINKGDSISFEIISNVPSSLPEKNFNISVNERFTDAKNVEYKIKSSTAITTSPKLLDVTKSMKDRIYLKDSDMVRIVLSNTGTFDMKNIRVNDSIGKDFILKFDEPLEWNIPLLKVGQDWSTVYFVKPLEANLNGYTIPATEVNFSVNNKNYSTNSATPVVVVNGPRIILNKAVNKTIANIGDSISVTVSINNQGDIGSRFELRDYLPKDVGVIGESGCGVTDTDRVDGVICLTNWSDPNSVQKFNYIIRANKEGNITLPPAILNYTNVEYKGTTRDVMSSDKIIIVVNDPKKMTTATPTPDLNSSSNDPPNTIRIPGFSGLALVIVILMITIINRYKNKNKK